MKLVLRFLKKYKLECIIAPLFKLLEACFDLMVPLVVRSIIDVGIANGDKTYIIQRCLILVALGIIGLVCAIIAQYFAAKAAVGMATGLRHSLFEHLGRFSYSNTDNMGTSSMITRMTSDVNQLQSGVNMTLRLFLRSPIIVFGAMIMAFFVDPDIAWIFVLVIPVLSVIVFGIILAGIPLYKKVQSKLDTVTSKTRETLSGVRVIRAFNKEQDEIRDFEDANVEHTRLQNFTGKITSLMNPLTYVIVNLGIIAIIYFSAPAVNSGEMSRGGVVAVYNYMTQILVELVKLANTIFLVTKALACARRVQSVFDTPVADESEKSFDIRGDENAPVVEFKNASLTYTSASAPSVSGVSFSAYKGMTVGIIGSTGSGKTTLVNMIPRFYDATEGEVRFKGLSVTEYDTEFLRSQIAIVPQKAVLFKGTVRSNLCWGKPDATDDELWDALRIAQAADFVADKDGGLDAKVEQKGRNFSGGQRQRLCIARAIVSKSPVLILDDSASALDFATEAKLRHAIRELDYNPCVFIISQRTSSIAHADLTLVLEDGEVVGIGKHSELLESCDVYREIYQSQFKGGDANV
ncbi:MAG: ABC transporter ATP-binding protein [Ruminococcaceae bacterium]|nr:ABC transporter ATP-binding protein [Oscillospiraceae bacterium]